MRSKLIVGQISSDVISVLNEQGLPVMAEAELDRPMLPPDITLLEDEDLMALYTQFSSYSDFVTTQLACAIVDEKELEQRLESAESAALIQRHSDATGKNTVTLLKALVDSDPNIVELKSQHLEKYAYRKLLETMANNCERGSQVCSRELTRRTSGDNYKTRTRKFTI